MRLFNRVVSLLMMALLLVTAVPFMPVSAVDDNMENYTFTIQNTCADSSLAESSAVNSIAFFGGTEFDGCYGNQLSGVARELYDSLVKNYATDKKTGKYTYKFETPYTFNAEFSGGAIVTNDELEEIILEINYAMQAAMDAFLYDHPEVFWLKIVGSSYGISVSGNSVYGYVGKISDVTITPIEIYSGASAKLSQYAEAVDSVLASIRVSESRYDTLKNVHDYICNNAWYNLINERRVHSSEPFFIGDGGVVCEGYSKSLKILCDRLDIPCVLVSGYAGENHMWNYVQMDDGKWYLIDATWDDQDDKIYDTYFLANANTVGFKNVTISEERAERNDFSGTGIFSFTYPVLSETAYTSHVHEWESDYTVDVEPTCAEKGSKSIHCKTCDETKSVTEMPATNHANKIEYPQQDATCTEKGYTAGTYCPDCKEWIDGHKEISVLSHTPDIAVIENRTEPECEIKGSYDEVVYCLVCDTEISRTEKEIPALTHSWNEGVINPVSTCKTHGTKTYTCQNDANHKKTEQVALDGNNHKGGTYLKDKADATCIANGYTGDVYCSGCNVKLETGKVINALGHEYSLSYTVDEEATCSAEGSKSKHCTRSGCTAKASVTAIAKLDHIYDNDCDNECNVCKEIRSVEHSYKTITTKATLSKKGEIVTECSVCGDTKITTVHRPEVITLSATEYTYDGKNKTPKVTVKDSEGNVLVKNVDYKTSVASKRSGIGRYAVKVTFIGKYEGTKKVYFTIRPGKPASVKSASQTTSSIKLSWSAVPGAAGYTVYRYSPSKKAYVKAGTTEGTSLTVKGLIAGTKYTFRVVAYGKTASGKVYNSKSYALIKTATKTKTPEITKVTATKGKAVLTHTNVSGETGYTVYYSTRKNSGFKKYANFKVNTTRADLTGLTRGKTYYFKVRTYITTSNGYVYSAWSSVKSVKIK